MDLHQLLIEENREFENTHEKTLESIELVTFMPFNIHFCYLSKIQIFHLKLKCLRVH